MANPRKTEYDTMTRQELLARGLSKQRVSQIMRARGQTREGEADAVYEQVSTLADGKLTFAEIAARVGRSPNTVKDIVHHMRVAGYSLHTRRAGR